MIIFLFLLIDLSHFFNKQVQRLNINEILGPKRELIYQHASHHTSFNEIFLITGDDKKTQLLEELDVDDAVLFQRAFATHCAKLHFNGDSGLNPHRILSLHVYITRISPTLYTLSSDESDDEML